MLEEEERISLLNQAKYLCFRHISEPEDNSLRLVVEEAMADRTETVATPDPASPFAELRKGASPVKSVEGCRVFELRWSRYVACLVTEEGVGSGGSDEDEVYTGNLFRVYTKSHFLDHLSRDTGGHNSFSLLAIILSVDVSPGVRSAGVPQPFLRRFDPAGLAVDELCD